MTASGIAAKRKTDAPCINIPIANIVKADSQRSTEISSKIRNGIFMIPIQSPCRKNSSIFLTGRLPAFMVIWQKSGLLFRPLDGFKCPALMQQHYTLL